MFALLYWFFGCVPFPHASPGFFSEGTAENQELGPTLMKRNVVAYIYSIAAVTLMAGCQRMPDAAKILDPSGLHLGTDTFQYTESIKDIAWSINDTHPCKPDQITGSGTAHWIIHTGFDANGGLHYNANIVSKGTATGSISGKAYIINEHFKDVEQVPSNYTSYVIYDSMRLKVDGPSIDYDYYKTTIVKIVVDAQGVPVVSVDSESNSCT